VRHQQLCQGTPKQLWRIDLLFTGKWNTVSTNINNTYNYVLS